MEQQRSGRSVIRIRAGNGARRVVAVFVALALLAAGMAMVAAVPVSAAAASSGGAAGDDGKPAVIALPAAPHHQGKPSPAPHDGGSAFHAGGATCPLCCMPVDIVWQPPDLTRAWTAALPTAPDGRGAVPPVPPPRTA
jgi:hypothetical protein